MAGDTEPRLSTEEMAALRDALSVLPSKLRERIVGSFATAALLVDAVNLMDDPDAGAWNICKEQAIRAKARKEIFREVVGVADDPELSADYLIETGQSQLEELHHIASRMQAAGEELEQ